MELNKIYNPAIVIAGAAAIEICNLFVKESNE